MCVSYDRLFSKLYEHTTRDFLFFCLLRNAHITTYSFFLHLLRALFCARIHAYSQEDNALCMRHAAQSLVSPTPRVTRVYGFSFTKHGTHSPQFFTCCIVDWVYSIACLRPDRVFGKLLSIRPLLSHPYGSVLPLKKTTAAWISS